jgi:YbbR domain-containing protein
VRRDPSTISAMRTDPDRRPPGRAGVGGWLRGALVDNIGLKALALILALTVYLLVNTDESREINARIRVAYDLPPGKALVSQRIDEVRVTIRGPWRRIKRFDEREIDRIDLDLRRATGGEVAITPDMISLPRGLELTSIEPRVIRVAFEEIGVKRVPVRPEFAGRALHGYEVVTGRTLIDPPVVAVRGAAGLIDALEAVRTQEIRIDGRNDSFVVTVPLVPPDGVQVVGDDLAKVTVNIEEELVTRRLSEVPVEIRAPPTGDEWTVTPARVAVTLTGGVVAVERWLDAGVAVVVTVPHTATEPVELPVEVVTGPAGVGVKVEPAHVRAAPKK